MMGQGRTLLIVLGLLLLSLLVFLYFYGYQAYYILYAKKLGRDVPYLYAVPQPITPMECSLPRGARLNFYGVSFSVPWTRPGNEMVQDRFTGVVFEDGSGLLFSPPSPESHRKDSFLAKIPNAVVLIFGGETPTNYSVVNAILETTPDSLRLQSSPELVDAQISILLIKWQKLRSEWGDWKDMHSFSTGDVKGFQFGRTGTGQPIHILVFDKEREYNFLLITSRGKPDALDQEEVNCVLEGIGTMKETSAE